MLNVHPWINHFARWVANRVPPFRLRQDIDQAAHYLIARHGDAAYEVARAQARDVPPGIGRDRFWSAVAVRIAELIGHTIGVSGADRYPGV